MTPEELGLLLDQLTEAKEVLDAYYTQVNMKKNRPGVLLTVLTLPKNTEFIEEFLLENSSTFGVRSYVVFRNILKRRFETFIYENQEIHLKIGEKNGKILKVVPEYEDVKKAALILQQPFKKIYVAAQKAGYEL